MKALIIGGTGATGRDLINVLLADADYTHIVIFVRRSAGIVHPKLTEHIIDFNQLENSAAHEYGSPGGAFHDRPAHFLEWAGFSEKVPRAPDLYPGAKALQGPQGACCRSPRDRAGRNIWILSS